MDIDRNLAIELVRGTEVAALFAARWMGRGNKEAADQAAVDAMRYVLGGVDMDGIVVIGEGEKDEAPMLFVGEHVGTGKGPMVDIAVDPIDGTRLLSRGLPNAMAVVAIAERDSLYYPPGIVYMEKIATGPSAAGAIDINLSVKENLRSVAAAKGYQVQDLTVVVLDRPRHDRLIAEIREAGARIKLISDGDVAGGIMTALEGTGIDVLMGIGGAPEAVLAACALKAVGGEIQCKLWPRNGKEREAGEAIGLSFEQVLRTNDLVKGENVFFAATGITDGELLRGVQYMGNGARTESIAIRSATGTVRRIIASHRWDKLKKVSGLPLDLE